MTCVLPKTIVPETYALAAFLGLGTVFFAAYAGAQTTPTAATTAAGAEAPSPDAPFEVLLLQGNLARGKRDFATADSFFRSAARKPEATPKLYIYWARTHRERGDLNYALRVVEAGLKRFPNDSALTLELGYLYSIAERWDDVAKLLAALPADAAALPFAQYLSGRVAAARNDYDAAIAAFERAAAAPHLYRAESYAELAMVQRAKGETALAVAAMQQALGLARTVEQRNEYQQRLEELQAAGSGDDRYSLLYLAGAQFDSNVNLAPELFAETSLKAFRTSHALWQRLTVYSHDRVATGLTILANQTFHVGAEQKDLNEFNASTLGADWFVHIKRKNARYGITAGYNTVFLFFKPEDPDFGWRFLERAQLTPSFAVKLGRFGLAGEVNLEHSRYGQGNTPGGVDDRRTASIDVVAQLAPYMVHKRHRISLPLGGNRHDAKGDNFDHWGIVSGLRYEWNKSPWVVLTGLVFEADNYPNHTNGREDRLLRIDVQSRYAFHKRHTLGLLASYEENFADDTSPFAYRRFIVGASYQGALLQL